MPYAIEIYTTNPCSFCLAAKNLLQKRGLEWREHLVFGGTLEWDAMIQRTGGKSVPQVIINGEVIGGFPELAAYDKEGKLQALASGAEADTFIPQMPEKK